MSQTLDAVTPGRIGFQLVAKVQGASFNPGRREGLRFDAGPPSNLSFSLRPTEEDTHGFGTDGLEYRVRTEVPASGETIAFVRSLIGGQYAPFGEPLLTLPLVVHQRTLIAADGVVAKGFSLRRELTPASVQQMLSQAEQTLELAGNRFLGLLRWRQGAAAEDKLIEYSSIYWRTDPGVYYAVPRPLTEPSTVKANQKGLRWSEEDDAALQELWGRDVQEPLAHELVREAQALVRQSPRSALLIAASAAEAGLKSHLSKILPGISWLLEEAPSPPIFKMLRDYVPAVNAAAGRDVSFWVALKPTLKAVNALVEARNKVAHTGRMPDGFDVGAAVEIVRDLLYVLDAVEGEHWAKHLIDQSLASDLGWPAPAGKDRTFSIRMMQPDDEAIRGLLARFAKT